MKVSKLSSDHSNTERYGVDALLGLLGGKNTADNLSSHYQALGT